LDILLMERKGLTQRQIAKKLGISRNTVKKYIEHKGYPGPDRIKINRKSMLDPFQGTLLRGLRKTWSTGLLGYMTTFDRWVFPGATRL